ncbi:MAG TPA: DUF6084 family protein [Verrucomicrobiae bacterium]|jgi:hypothetical protein|nr:DUF6084 family protein [Verrucomicrobiae bacterium]
MPELDFQIVGVQPVLRGLTPLLHFKLKISAAPADAPIQSVLLNAQIQIQPPQRAYTAVEKERLVELFGSPERWGQTLRNRLWAHASATAGNFTGTTEATLPVPCTYDLNIAATKYFYALEGGEVSLLFLFSGSIFYLGPDGHLQVERISWNKECVYRIPVQTWKDLMEEHYPNTAWISLPRDTFDRLWAYRREHGHTNWEQTLTQLLAAEKTSLQEALA